MPPKPLLSPIYELELKGSETPSVSEILEVELHPHDRLELRCTTDGNDIDETTLDLMSPTVDIQVAKEKGKITYKIDSFDPAKHSAVYECWAKRKSDDKDHSRKMRLRRKVEIPKGSTECADNHCLNGGVCVLDALAQERCICPENFSGADCASPTVIVSEGVYEAAKVAAGAGGGLTCVLVMLTLIFAFLFVKERKKRRLLVETYGPIEKTPLEEESFYFADVSNPYKECKQTDLRPKDTVVIATEEGTSPSAGTINQSFKKFRNAIRARLPGTSDSKLVQDWPGT